MTLEEFQTLRPNDLVHTERPGRSCREDVLYAQATDLGLPRLRSRWAGGGCLPVYPDDLAFMHRACECEKEA